MLICVELHHTSKAQDDGRIKQHQLKSIRLAFVLLPSRRSRMRQVAEQRNELSQKLDLMLAATNYSCDMYGDGLTGGWCSAMTATRTSHFVPVAGCI
jgi:hypothetical protein